MLQSMNSRSGRMLQLTGNCGTSKTNSRVSGISEPGTGQLMVTKIRKLPQEVSVTMSASQTPKLGDDFWHEIADRLRFFIRSRVEDSHTAEDLAQDVILKAQRNLHSAPMHQLSAWMFQIAKNVVIDHYRSRNHRRSAQLDDVAAIAESETVVVSELSGCIRPMLARLPDAYREALEQTDLGELTQTELAKHLGLSLPGVKSRVQRAREQLRTVLVSCCAPKTDRDGSVVDHGCDCQPPDYCSKKSGKC